MRHPIRNYTYQELQAVSRPKSADQPEAFADYIWDVRTYLDAATTTLRFFSTTQAALTLSNLQLPGQLQAANYFSIDEFRLDLWPDAGWATTTAGGVPGIADDIGLLLYQGRPTLTLNLNQKPYGPWPAIGCKGMGGVNGFGWGTFTAEESIQLGNNAPGSGLFIGGSIIIPPLTGFFVDIDWSAAQDLTDDYRVRLTMTGTRYREVV